MAYTIHPAADLFPLLDSGDLAALAEDIRTHGLHEPVWLWDDPQRGTVLLDGRNRHRACQLAGIEPATRLYHGDDPIAFSLSQNLKRRHMTAGQRDFLALEVEALYAAEAKRTQGTRTDLPPSDFRADLPESNERRSRERAGKAVSASGRGVSQAKRVQQAAPDLAEKVRSGQMAIDRAERIIRDREAEQRRIEQARAEAAAEPEPSSVDIRLGDFRDVLADVECVDAIITDPPYAAEFLPLLGDLAAWADKVLTPDGVMAILFGQTYLPEVYQLLDGHRPYRWTGCWLTEGPAYVSHARRVHSNWKPLLVYGGGPRFTDVIRSEIDASAKSNHDWGQGYAAFHALIEKLTHRGQTVADPFMGSGTTLLAAHSLGRHAIGCDISRASVATARERLS